MNRRRRFLASLVLSALGACSLAGCGGGSQRSEVNTHKVEPLKPGEAPDIRDSFKVNKPKG